MAELRELKNETTLSAIAEDPSVSNHFLLYAIVIDISEPYKKEDNKNYTTKLKVIDPSFNYKMSISNPSLKFHKFVHINVYSEDPKSAPKIQHVGDIIRLRRFQFKLTPKKELMGNMKSYSNWLIYSGDKRGALVSNCYRSFEKNKNRSLNNYEKGRLYDLRMWNDSYFFQNSLKYITWWTGTGGGNNLKVDLILQCKKIVKKTLTFIDEEKNEYQLKLKTNPQKIKNEIIKLRCVNIKLNKNKPNEIKLTQLTSCLLIPKYFYDSRKFLKMTGGKKSAGRNKLESQYTWLSNYNLADQSGKKSTKSKKIVSVVKNTITKNKKVTSVSQMKKYMNKEDKVNEKFVMKGFVLGFVETKPEKVIKKMNKSNQKITDLKQKRKSKTHYRTVYNLIMMLKDNSCKRDEYMNVYITTEQGDNRLFETWNLLPQSDSKDWAKVSSKQLKEFEKRLKNLQNPLFEVNVGVQILKTKKNQKFLKLVDTVFLPLN